MGRYYYFLHIRLWREVTNTKKLCILLSFFLFFFYSGNVITIQIHKWDLKLWIFPFLLTVTKHPPELCNIRLIMCCNAVHSLKSNITFVICDWLPNSACAGKKLFPEIYFAIQFMYLLISLFQATSFCALYHTDNRNVMLESGSLKCTWPVLQYSDPEQFCLSPLTRGRFS